MNAFLHLETPPSQISHSSTNSKHLPTLPQTDSRKLGKPSAYWSEVYTYSINLTSSEAEIQDILVKDPSAIATQASRSHNNSAGHGTAHIVAQEGPGNQSGSNFKVVCWPRGCNEPMTVHSIGKSRQFLHIRNKNNKQTREMPLPPEGSDVSLGVTDEDRLKMEDSMETLHSIIEVSKFHHKTS